MGQRTLRAAGRSQHRAGGTLAHPRTTLTGHSNTKAEVCKHPLDKRQGAGETVWVQDRVGGHYAASACDLGRPVAMHVLTLPGDSRPVLASRSLGRLSLRSC